MARKSRRQIQTQQSGHIQKLPVPAKAGVTEDRYLYTPIPQGSWNRKW